MSAKTQRLLKKLPKNYVNFVGGYREELLSLQSVFVIFRMKNSYLWFGIQKSGSCRTSSHPRPTTSYQISSRNKKSCGNLKNVTKIIQEVK